MKVYSSSQNKELANQYNAMRKDLGELLRSIEELKTMKDENAQLILSQLKNAKNLLKDKDYNDLHNVEEHICAYKHSVTNGNLILKDNAFVSQIANQLTEAVEIMFAKE